MSNEATPSLAPGQLAGDPNDPFILTRTKYIDLQLYVTTGKNMPTTADALKASWGLTNQDIDVSVFSDLLHDYLSIVKHCTTWEGDTLPKLRGLADDIYNYGIQCPDYYNGLLDALNVIADPNSTPSQVAQAKSNFKDLANDLSKQIAAFSTNCATVRNGINQFRMDSTADHQNLTNRYTIYNTKFNATNGDIEQLKDQMKDWKRTLDEAGEEYKQDVITAATTAAYAWIVPFGTIAAAIIAGIYGDKAVKAKATMEAAQKQINDLGNEITRDQNMMLQLTDALKQILDIDGKCSAALAVLDEVKDAWDSIGSDLADLTARIDKISSADASDIIKKVNIKTSITEWSGLKDEADQFRHHFSISVVGTPGAPATDDQAIAAAGAAVAAH